jgi:hypothetical protein
MVGLQQGRVREALDLSRKAVQRARDASHDKMLWRSNALLAHALAESLLADQAVAELPPISTRVDGQDAVYDTEARVRTHIAAGDLPQALADAKSMPPALADLSSPADAVAEGAAEDPAWLRTFVEALPAHVAPDSTPRAGRPWPPSALRGTSR